MRTSDTNIYNSKTRGIANEANTSANAFSMVIQQKQAVSFSKKAIDNNIQADSLNQSHKYSASEEKANENTNMDKSGTEAIQRKIYLPYGDSDEVEPATLQLVLNALKVDKIKVSPQQTEIIKKWVEDDNEERIYNAMFDMKELVTDVKKELDQLPPEKRSWKQGLDPQAFAWNKLVGFDETEKQARQKAILDAAKVIVHPNITSDIKGVWLNITGDFPVKIILAGDGTIHAINVLGSGRETEILSYLRIIGVRSVERAQEEETDVEGYLYNQLGLGDEEWWPRNIHLSIMPLSIVFQLHNPLNYFCTDKGSPYSFASFQVKDETTDELQNHIVCDIKWANGIVVEHLIKTIAKAGITLDSANLHGICGSLTPALSRGTMVVPRGDVESLSPGHKNKKVHIPGNDVIVPGGMYVMDHGHVSTIMQEDDESLWRLLEESQVHTLEMETYHFVKALEEIGHEGEIKIVFTVSDVMTSPHENLGNPEPKNEQSLKDRKQKNKVIIEAFGLGKSKILNL